MRITITVSVFITILFLPVCQGASNIPAAPNPPFQKIVMFGWRTAGSEVECLKELLDVFSKQQPNIKVVNVSATAPPGTDTKALVKTLILTAGVPDVFEVRGGVELIRTWVVTDIVEPITDIWTGRPGDPAAEAWEKAFPQGLLDLVSYKGEVYAIPAGVQRCNVLWYNKKIFDKNGLEPPTTFEKFWEVANVLQARGIIPLAQASKEKWEISHLFEDVLLGISGPGFYRQLFEGKVPWTDSRVRQALETMVQMFNYINADHAGLTWEGAADLVIQGKAAMIIMGDWIKEYFTAHNWMPDEDFGALPSPGTEGSFIAVVDAFCLPKTTIRRYAVYSFFQCLGSIEGQEAFNATRGSIPARIDIPREPYDRIAQREIDDLATNELVPSLAHGSASVQAFTQAINEEMHIFIKERDVNATAQRLEQLAKDFALIN